MAATTGCCCRFVTTRVPKGSRWENRLVQVAPGADAADLECHWRLDETSGTNAEDDADNDNDNDGTLNGDASWCGGRVGGGLELAITCDLRIC